MGGPTKPTHGNKIGPYFQVRVKILTNRSGLRSAGDFWGGRLADMVIAEAGRPARSSGTFRMSFAERMKAMIKLGANDDDIAAWADACAKRFVARMVSHIDQLGGPAS